MKWECWCLLVALSLTSCGFVVHDGDAVGQVKWAEHVTPLICPNADVAGLSLGIISGGSGSVSTHDVTVQLMNDQVWSVFSEAAKKGGIVHIKYRERRATFCLPNVQVLWAERVQ